MPHAPLSLAIVCNAFPADQQARAPGRSAGTGRARRRAHRACPRPRAGPRLGRGREHRVAEPIVDFSLFRNGPYFGASAVAFALVGAYWSVMFFQSQYLQDVRGHSAVLSGLLILPVTVMAAMPAEKVGIASGVLAMDRAARARTAR